MLDLVMRQTANNFQKAHSTNSTASSFAAKVPTLTAPSGDGVIDLVRGNPNRSVSARVLMMFYGAGADDSTFDARIIGWRLLGSTWMPTILLELTCTLSTYTGISGGDILTTDRVADTIVQKTAYDGQADKHFSILTAGTNLPASIEMNTRGSSKLEIIFDMTGATNGNVMVAEQ